MKSNDKIQPSMKKSLPVLQFTEKPIVILTNKICSQINYLHREVGNIEWSAVLLYSHEKGGIDNPKDMVLVAEELFLMDIGTSGYTEYINDVDSVLEMFETHPKLESGEWKMGHIHTHHNLGSTNFSGTDMDELQENAGNYNYYLSLIVDFKCAPTAKIATICTIEPQKITHPGANGNVSRTINEEKRLGIYDCNIVYNVNQVFVDRYSSVKNKKKEEQDLKLYQKNKWDSWDKEKYESKTYQNNYPDIPQNYYGYGFDYRTNKNNTAQRNLFKESNFSEFNILNFILKWIMLEDDSKYTSLDEAIDQIDQLIKGKDIDLETYLDELFDSFEDLSTEIIGEGYDLTTDEKIKLIQITIDLLEPYITISFVNNIINELEEFQILIEEEI